MWTYHVFGTDVYHLIAAFMAYSVIGWCLESIYMSFCNKKLTNRGFGKGPFCPIYGFGGVIGYLILSPFAGNYVAIYIVGAVAATTFEFITGVLMIRFLGQLWWDYNEKPFNYKGIICLESTVAWGFYALGIVGFVHKGIIGMIDHVDMSVGIKIVTVIFVAVVIDYTIQFCKVFHVDFNKPKDFLIDKYHSFKARWY